jgi:formate dehydrogenase
LLPY